MSPIPHTTGEPGLPQISAAPLREKVILPVLGLTVVLVIMNTAMFNLALPKVESQFSLSPSVASWIVSGYSIVFALSSITFSRLSDFLPIRLLITISLLFLGAGSVAGILSDRFAILLATRLVQASGAGAMVSLSYVLLTRYTPESRRGRAMAVISASVSLGIGLGPVVGGAIVQYIGWHFLFVVPAATVVLIPLLRSMIPKEHPAPGSFDALGGLLLGIAAATLLLFVTSTNFWILFGGIVALALFIFRIRSAPHPFVLPGLFSDKLYLVRGAIGISVYTVNFTLLFLAPQMLAEVFGLTSGASGLVLFPGSLLGMLVSILVGRMIDLFGNNSFFRYVPWLLFASTIALALTATRSWGAVLGLYIVVCVCFSSMTSAVSNEMSRRLPPERLGSGMGLFQMMQFFAGAFGIALSGSAIAWQQGLTTGRTFNNILWGIVGLSLLGIVSSVIYLRMLHTSEGVSGNQ